MLHDMQLALFGPAADPYDEPDDSTDTADREAAAALVEETEAEIDSMNADLAPLRSFVLPGGTPLSAHLHLARTVCRRAERLAVALAEKPEEKVATED